LGNGGDHQYVWVMTEYNDAKRKTDNMTGPDGTSSSSAAHHNPFRSSTIVSAINNNSNNISSIILSSNDRSSSTNQRPSTENTTHGGTTEQVRSSSPSSFAQLAFRTFETYITHNQQQQQRTPYYQHGEFLEPIALRRIIHSTPLLRHTQSELSVINDDDDYCGSDEEESPPAGLEILDHARSRSTPLSTSKNSAFGTIPRTNSQNIENNITTSQTTDYSFLSTSDCHGGGSAFSLPPYAMLKASKRSNARVTRSVIFNPIQHEDEILTTTDCDDGLGEMTSIEVTNVPLPSAYTNRRKEKRVIPQLIATKKKSTASRAAKFLMDVRNLRISSGNGGKSGSGGRFRARPSSISSDESPSSITDAANCNITVSDGFGDRNGLIRSTVLATSKDITSNDNSTKRTAVRDEQQYSVLNPEPGQIAGREGCSHIQHLQDSHETTSFPASISSSSGNATHATLTSISSSSNGQSYASHLSAISETDREVANVNHLRRNQRRSASKSNDKVVCDQIELSLSSDQNIRNGGSYNSSINSISRMDGASVRADRFFGYKSDLSYMDKPDCSRLRNLPPFCRRGGSAQSPSTGSNVSLNTSSTVSSRGGDEPPKIVSYMNRKQVSDLTSLHLRGDSLETSSPRAGYVDRELRDSSPSEMIEAKHSDVFLEGAHTTKIDICNKPQPHCSSKGIQFGRKIRSSLPPRSPCNGWISSTTSPPSSGSPAYNTVSPPHQIIDHRIDPMNTNPRALKPCIVDPISSRVKPRIFNAGVLSMTSLPGSDQGSHEVIRLSPNRQFISDSSRSDYYNLAPVSSGSSPVYGQQLARTYEENSTEILKTDSKEKEDDNNPSSIPLVTPDKARPFSS